MELYCERLSELDKTVRRMVVESLGLEKYMEEHMSSTNYVARVQKYTGPQTRDAKIGLLPHTDKSIVTILHQFTQVTGLQVLSKDGKKWIDADPISPDSFLVMIGNCLHAWTNGRLHAPYHRVMMSGDHPRYSIGLFSNPKPGSSVIKAPEEMVDDDHPLLYKPFDYFEFIEFFYSDVGRTSPNALLEYCGA